MARIGSESGFLATARGPVPDRDVADVSTETSSSVSRVEFEQWGLHAIGEDPAIFVLSPVARTAEGAVAPSRIADAMRTEPARLEALLPPFAAVRADVEAVAMVSDSMGFRQLYHSAPGLNGVAALSSSALRAGWAIDADLDLTAVAVQSQLGWQLGQRTLHAGIEKLAPRTTARLSSDGVGLISHHNEKLNRIDLGEAVQRTAALLRTSMSSLLDDHPDAVLQLTGGQDSRLLLSAIPVARRRGLRAMTLGTPDNGDVRVARALAEKYGLVHEVHDFGDLDRLSPADAWRLTRAAAYRLDGMSDPIAHAALGVAEARFEQGVRISGLGGEVARGFYYMGRVRQRGFDHTDAHQLAAWRMFSNEAVEADVLEPEFERWAKAEAHAAVFSAVKAGGSEWFTATDELYLRHRMQRWAGVTDTAVIDDRVVINPMLDEVFLTIASRLSPRDKANSRFLASLQMELDPTLGRIPLEGRPAPIAYATSSPFQAVARAASTGRQMSSKVLQRLRRGTRPPAGGAVLAAQVVEHWRNEPGIIARGALPGFVRQEWVDGVLERHVEPQPSSVAFVTNLLAAHSPSIL